MISMEKFLIRINEEPEQHIDVSLTSPCDSCISENMTIIVRIKSQSREKMQRKFAIMSFILISWAFVNSL